MHACECILESSEPVEEGTLICEDDGAIALPPHKGNDGVVRFGGPGISKSMDAETAIFLLLPFRFHPPSPDPLTIDILDMPRIFTDHVQPQGGQNSAAKHCGMWIRPNFFGKSHYHKQICLLFHDNV